MVYTTNFFKKSFFQKKFKLFQLRIFCQNFFKNIFRSKNYFLCWDFIFLTNLILEFVLSTVTVLARARALYIYINVYIYTTLYLQLVDIYEFLGSSSVTGKIWRYLNKQVVGARVMLIEQLNLAQKTPVTVGTTPTAFLFVPDFSLIWAKTAQFN